MTDPVLVEITRGQRVESWHRGAFAVVDADGSIHSSAGDIETPHYPRSAVKAIQGLVAAECGVFERFSFGDREIALACASHGGEPDHVVAANEMLTRAGLDAACLGCGAHWPSHAPAAYALAAAGNEPSALHNNCSGKHAAFLCAAVMRDEPVQGYVRIDHPIQRAVKEALEDVTRYPLSAEPGIDGCAIPTHAIPLRDLAFGFARFTTGTGLAPQRAQAARRLRAACAAEPWFVAGTGRLCTEIMEQFGARIFVKAGAEGVFCSALPELGLGIALKCDDGATRAAEVVMASLLASLLVDNADREALSRWTTKAVRNVNGEVVGEVRAAGKLYDPPG